MTLACIFIILIHADIYQQSYKNQQQIAPSTPKWHEH